MLTAPALETVRATLPAVGAAIGDITPIFYRRLFDAHPALERDLFNRANQAQGDQQRALAGAIAAYASLLVAEDGPDPRLMLARIGNKHASLGVTADLYPVVYEHLFAAIVDVLGDIITPDIAAAWTEVYWDMANALIEVEHGLYSEAAVADGDVWRAYVVRERRLESRDTVSFVLATPDGSAFPAWKPGQYISVAVDLPDGAHQIRQYSLTGSGSADSARVTVKAVPAVDAAVPAGEVSNFLFENVFEGDRLQASLPFGELTLPDGDAPLLLISAGIGLTPILGFLQHLHSTGSARRVDVVHADRSPAAHSHRAEMLRIVDEMPAASLLRWYEDPGATTADLVYAGRVDLEQLALESNAEVYLCGPLAFMAAVRAGLIRKGVHADSIHYEVFGPGPELQMLQAA